MTVTSSVTRVPPESAVYVRVHVRTGPSQGPFSKLQLLLPYGFAPHGASAAPSSRLIVGLNLEQGEGVLDQVTGMMFNLWLGLADSVRQVMESLWTSASQVMEPARKLTVALLRRIMTPATNVPDLRWFVLAKEARRCWQAQVEIQCAPQLFHISHMADNTWCMWPSCLLMKPSASLQVIVDDITGITVEPINGWADAGGFGVVSQTHCVAAWKPLPHEP